MSLRKKSSVKKKGFSLTEPQIKDLGIESLPEVRNNDSKMKSLIVKVIVLLILLSALGAGIYFFLQYQKTQNLLKNPTLNAQLETQTLIKMVDNLVELPEGENPTVATVKDVTKLKTQPFFARAQNGDKVLIYQNAKKAILYRPSTNKIVEFGPVNLGPSEQTSASPSAVTDAPKLVNVVLRNGTKTAGLAASVEKELKTSAPNIVVVSKDNASKQDYTKTLVVDLSGDRMKEAAELAKTLNGEVGKLPTGEKAPTDADILVILGKP